MSSRTDGIFFRLRPAILLLTTAAALPRAGAEEPSQSASETSKTPAKEPTIAVLAGGQVLVGEMQVKSLTIRTRYGELAVPVEEIIKVRFRSVLAPEETAELEALLKVLLDENEELEMRAGTLAGFEKLGPPALHRLEEARKKIKNDQLLKKIEEAAAEPRAEEDEALLEDDEIAARSFTMRGHIIEEAIRFECVLGTLEIPRRDLRSVTRRELELKKSWKIDSRYTERGPFLNTEFKVKKGQRINLEATGSMNYQGNSFGPAGLLNHTWNNRPVGCLQWRIGDGSWEMFGNGFRGKAPAAGTLQFCLHLFSPASGGFEITLTTKSLFQ